VGTIVFLSLANVNEIYHENNLGNKIENAIDMIEHVCFGEES
jgi:hypothetical protein